MERDDGFMSGLAWRREEGRFPWVQGPPGNPPAEAIGAVMEVRNGEASISVSELVKRECQAQRE